MFEKLRTLTYRVEALPGTITEPLVRRVYLFASRTRGTQKTDNDANLAILHAIEPAVMLTCDDLTVARILTWMDWEQPWAAALQHRLAFRVHLQTVERVSPIVWSALKACRICLYRRGASL